MKIEIEVKFFMKDLFFFLTPAKPNRERCLCVCSIKVADPETSLRHGDVGGRAVAVCKRDKVEGASCNVTNGSGSRCKLCFETCANVGTSMNDLALFGVEGVDLITQHKEPRPIGHVDATVHRRYSGDVLGEQRREGRECAVRLAIVNKHPATDSISRSSTAKSERGIELDALNHNLRTNAIVTGGTLRNAIELCDACESNPRLGASRRSRVQRQTIPANSRIVHCTVEELDFLCRGPAIKPLNASSRKAASRHDDSSTSRTRSSKTRGVFGMLTASTFFSSSPNKPRRGASTRHVYSSIFVYLKMMTSE